MFGTLVMLYEFIDANREEIVRRCRAKVATRSMPPPTPAEIDHGVPVFLNQLQHALRFGLSMSSEIGVSALQHGHDLLLQGFTVSQVVHDYGDICQAITELAVEMEVPISTEDFRTLNRCLEMTRLPAPSPSTGASAINPASTTNRRKATSGSGSSSTRCEI